MRQASLRACLGDYTRAAPIFALGFKIFALRIKKIRTAFQKILPSVSKFSHRFQNFSHPVSKIFALGSKKFGTSQLRLLHNGIHVEGKAPPNTCLLPSVVVLHNRNQEDTPCLVAAQ